MLARISKPSRTAMQSGKAATENWTLEYEPEHKPDRRSLDGLHVEQRHAAPDQPLEFDDARGGGQSPRGKNGIPYHGPGRRAAAKKLSYSDNFRSGRPQPWTH